MNAYKIDMIDIGFMHLMELHKLNMYKIDMVYIQKMPANESN